MADYPKIRRVTWRRQSNGILAAYYVVPKHIAVRGYPIKTYPLWRGARPGPLDIVKIIAASLGVRRELSDWMRNPDSVRKPPARGAVYFARCDDRVKIGFSSNPQKRVLAMQTASAGPISLITQIPGTRDTEKAFHIAFAELRVGGEWFRFGGRLREAIENGL